MPEHFINLNCANCGAKLEVYDEMQRFHCGYCGTELIVQRRGGTVALKAVKGAIKKVQIGTDKTAAELALVRLNQESVKIDAELKQLTTAAKAIKAEAKGDRVDAMIGGVIGLLGLLHLFGGFAMSFTEHMGEHSGLVITFGLLMTAVGLGSFPKSRGKATSDKLMRIEKQFDEKQEEIDINQSRVAEQRRIVDSN